MLFVKIVPEICFGICNKQVIPDSLELSTAGWIHQFKLFSIHVLFQQAFAINNRCSLPNPQLTIESLASKC